MSHAAPAAKAMSCHRTPYRAFIHDLSPRLISRVRRLILPWMTTPDPAAWASALSGPVTFQGDAHGKLAQLARPGHPVVQVGDLGAGFVPAKEFREQVSKRGDFRFIRGNHDDPAICRKDPRYLGDWGGGAMFWVSGAWSIDRAWRVEGRDWWPDEELDAAQMRDAFDAYAEARPRLMITHEGPACLFEPGGPMPIRGYEPSATASLLQAMLDFHRPEAWIFGHHHVSRDFMLRKTRFRCLAELETQKVEFDGHGGFSW